MTEIEGVSPNEEQRDFVYGNYLDEVLIMVDPSGDDHYYAHDHLFSPVALIADDGTVEERYEYDAYGKCTIWDATFANTRSTSLYDNDRYFTGQMLDILDSGDLLIMYYKNRYYLVDLGRFIQNDPLGTRDGICIIEFTDSGVPHFPRKNNAIGQYRDGMSLYEYVKSNPLINDDPFGLKSDDQVCCKIKEKHTRTTTYSRPLYRTVTKKWTTCTQNTIINSKGLNPKYACKCHYKNNPNISVYDSHSGPCRWCDVYVTQVKSGPAKDKHAQLVIICKTESDSYVADVEPGVGKNPVLATFYSDTTIDVGDFGEYQATQILRAWHYCSISRDQAIVLRNSLDGADWTYMFTGANCIDFARGMAKQICKGCP